jgi:hypothetical protein
MSEYFFQAIKGDATGSQNDRRISREINDCRFHSNPTRSTIEHNIHVVSEVSHNVGCGGGTHTTKTIRRRRSDSSTKRSKQFQRDWMVRNSQAKC